MPPSANTAKPVPLLRFFLVTRFLSIAATVLFMLTTSAVDGPLVATEGFALAVNLTLILANIVIIALVFRQSPALPTCSAAFMALLAVYDFWQLYQATSVQSPSAAIHGVGAIWCVFWVWFFLAKRADGGKPLWQHAPSGN